MKKIIIAIAMMSSFSAFSAGKPYGYAGCGLGSVLIGKGEPQIIAATTNDLSTQTFSISSGTSNCVTVEDKTAQIKNFIEANYESLITDMAKGNGDTVYTLSSMYGCEKNIFVKELQKNYSQFSTTEENATVMMNQLSKIIKESDLRTSCYYVI